MQKRWRRKRVIKLHLVQVGRPCMHLVQACSRSSGRSIMLGCLRWYIWNTVAWRWATSSSSQALAHNASSAAGSVMPWDARKPSPARRLMYLGG